MLHLVLSSFKDPFSETVKIILLFTGSTEASEATERSELTLAQVTKSTLITIALLGFHFSNPFGKQN
jgi:hypothetical protein